MTITRIMVESWCVMHAEPTYPCDYDFFDSETEALNYADNVIGNSLADGVPLSVYVMKVHWSFTP